MGKNLITKVKSFVNLEQDWDRYHADPIPLESIKTGLRIAKHLPDSFQVFPHGAGGLQFEWEKGDTYIELDVRGEQITLFIEHNNEVVLLNKINNYVKEK